MLALGTFETVADRFLMPALVALGEAWAAGRIDVAGEHAREPRRAPPLVRGLPGGR